jgi:hypothetical protein
MAIFEHVPPTNIILKETTPEILAELGIGFVEQRRPSPLPDSFSIRSEMTSVESQGRLGTCTSFCVTALLEHIHRNDLSEAQITHEAEKRFGDCNGGLAVAHGMAQANDPGVCDERWWGYDGVQICFANPPDVSGKPRFRFKAMGAIYQVPRAGILEDVRTRSTDFGMRNAKSLAVRQNLYHRGRGVAMSVPVFWSAGWSMGPDIQLPSPMMMDQFGSLSDPTVDGWHCIAVCGYDDRTGRFTFKNSWDTWWGDQGYGTLPYQYVERFSDLAMVGW